MSRFVADLKRGNGAQQLIMQLYNDCEFTSEKVSPRGPERSFWDVVTTGNGLSFTTEVKFDEYEAKSGNIAIETFNPRLNKPSGLGITRAFFWAHVLVGGVVWLTPTERLRIFVQETEPKRIIGKGGDGNATLYLYDSSVILPAIFTRIDQMSRKELLQYIKDQCNVGPV